MVTHGSSRKEANAFRTNLDSQKGKVCSGFGLEPYLKSNSWDKRRGWGELEEEEGMHKDFQKVHLQGPDLYY